VEPGNVQELRERIEEVLRRPALSDRLGRAGRERVLDRFTWHMCAQRCLEEYAELAAE